MSFSSDVKKELCNVVSDIRHCDIAEIAGILNACASIYHSPKVLSIQIQTENPSVAKKIFTLIKKTFSVNSLVSIAKNKQFKKSRVYTLNINQYSSAEKILRATGLMTEEHGVLTVKKQIHPFVVKSECCKRAYIRGAFVGGGSLCNPEKFYHMEFIHHHFQLCSSLSKLIQFFHLNPKVIARKGHYLVYLKESEDIVDMLNIMGAYVSLMDLENVRILKDMRNNVNRVVNCETANLNKTVEAAVKQIEDICMIQENYGFDFLPEPLADIARVRLQYPEASLKELGNFLSPAVGKSGVNHRLRKISMIAEDIRIAIRE